MDQLYTSLGIIHLFGLIGDAGSAFHQWDPESSLTSRNLARDSRYLDGSIFFGVCWLDRFFSFSGSQSLAEDPLSKGVRGMENMAMTLLLLMLLMPKFLLTAGGVLSCAYAFILTLVDYQFLFRT